MPFPNNEQKYVINYNGQRLIIVAPPGTGKTRTLIARMERLLSEDADRNITFITFTRTSRRDAERRLKETVGIAKLKDAKFKFPRTCTLHTYAKSLVHEYAELIGRDSHFSVLVEEKGEKSILLRELIHDLNLTQIDIQTLNNALSRFHSTNYWPEDFPATPKERKEINEKLEFLLNFYNTFIIDSLIIAACRIIKIIGDDLPHIYLQVDEYQDLNPNDQRLIQLMSFHPRSEVIVVGDEAQSIYSFRYANYRGIGELWSSKEWEHIIFPDSHRLPIHIRIAASALIKDEGYISSFGDYEPDDGSKILTLECTTADLQIEAIAHQIKILKKESRTKNGKVLSFKDFMILCPTSGFVDKMAIGLEQDFDIPTKRKIKGIIPDDYWKLVLVLRMLYSSDSLALRQWLAIVGLSESNIRSIRNEAIDNKSTLFDHCSTLTNTKIRKIFDALKQLRVYKENNEKFCQALKEFPNLSITDEILTELGLINDESSKKKISIISLINFIYEKYGLIDFEDEITEEDRVLVTTLYSAKGLEAEFVFIAWMNSSFMPMQGRDYSEERRVLYVGLTRPKQDVIITFYETYKNNRRYGMESMSPFLAQIKDHLEIKRVRAGDLRGSIRD